MRKRARKPQIRNKYLRSGITQIRDNSGQEYLRSGITQIRDNSDQE